MSFTAHIPAFNPHPNHNHTEFNSDLNVHVTGGDRVERELLVDAISSTLKKRGFEGVKAIGPHGYNTGNEFVPPKTIYDTVEKMRPDLLSKNIAVTSQQDSVAHTGYGAPIIATIIGSSNDGNKTYTSKDGVKAFLNEAGELGATDKLVVSGLDRNSVTRAATELLMKSPGSEVTMKIELQPWQLDQKRFYSAPMEKDEKDPNGYPKANLVEYTAPVPMPYPY